MVKVTIKGLEGGKLQALQAALVPAQTDRVVERVALVGLRKVVEATPKKWFGQVRRSWQIQKPREGVRALVNDNKIMLFLERGTMNGGTGYITPKRKKFLYIPKNRNAALGWHPGLVRGRDYILVKRAKGIKPRRIAERMAKEIDKLLLEAMKTHIRAALAKAK
jgi:hypothetical protein